MAIDVHAIAYVVRGETYILLFDDLNREQMVRQLECWSIDPAIGMSIDDSARLIEQVQTAPEWNPGEPVELFRGGLGALDSA
jgi:hypothetical protein